MARHFGTRGRLAAAMVLGFAEENGLSRTVGRGAGKVVPLILRLLGRFDLATATGDPLALNAVRGQLLLARLALSAGVRLDRSLLSAMLWGERADARARASLRQLIWSIRGALGPNPDALVADGATLRLDPGEIRIDTTEFDQLAASADLGDLEKALALYRGELLEGVDLISASADGYFLHQRNRMRDLALQVVGSLVDGYGRDGQLDAAVRVARRGLVLDPYDEALHGRLIDLLQRLGRHREARDQDAAFRNLMKTEFGVTVATAALPTAARAGLTMQRPDPRPAHPPHLTTTQNAPAVPVANLRRPIWSYATITATATAILGAFGLSIWLYGANGSAKPALATAPSVVVLPFRDISIDGRQPEYAAALTADLVTDLSRVSGIFVMANQPGTEDLTDQGAVAAARRLGVGHAVTGTVQVSVGKMRASVALIDVTTGQSQWTAKFDRDLSELFAVQDEMVQSIVASLEVKLKGTEIAAIGRIPTKSLEAYDQYLRAEERRLVSMDADQLRRALAGYRRAIDLDPDFAEAHAGYARAAVEVWQRGLSEVMSGAVARQLAYEAAGRALELDPGNARALVVLSCIQLQDGARDSALTSARRAVAAQPNDAEARANLALVLSYAGTNTEARAELKILQRLDPTPRPEWLLVFGQVAFADGRYDGAVADFVSVWPTLPQNTLLLEHLAAALALQGRLGQAHIIRDRLLDLMPTANLHRIQAQYAALLSLRHQDRLLEGLRRAGLPDWPYGFKGTEDLRLTGPDLEAITTGVKWSGHLGNGNAFQLQSDDLGNFTFHSDAGQVVGRQFLRNGGLCQVATDRPEASEICGPIYRSAPEHDPDSQFVFVSADEVRYFSVSD